MVLKHTLILFSVHGYAHVSAPTYAQVTMAIATIIRQFGFTVNLVSLHPEE